MLFSITTYLRRLTLNMTKNMTKKMLVILVLTVAFVLALSSAAPAADEFVKGFNKNLELYPNWIGVDAQGLPTTMPLFQYVATDYITERVWVEVPCDTDRDGIRDRVSLWIRRPVTKDGFLCPVVMEFSPYHNGTVSYPRMANYINSTDDHLRSMAETFQYKQNYPVTLAVNPDTFNRTYSDIKYKGTEAWDPIWWQSKGAFTVDSWYTGTTYGLVPAATVPSSVAASAPSAAWPAVSGGSGVPARWLHYYTRGYALVFGQLLGNRDSTGITSSLHVEEWLSAAAACKWFNGEATAFTSQWGDVEVKCTWSNGRIGMDGTSYPGTTPTVAAMAQCTGLKAIMPEANVTSWYEYYRSGGSLHCPDGYGGEDMNLHSSYNFSRFNADISGNNVVPLAVGPNFDLAAQKAYVQTQQYMMEKQDRTTGDYNDEWDARNLTRGYGKIPSDVGILQTNGQQDWNVMPRHGFEMLQAMRDRFGGTHKMVSGLTVHASQSSRLVPGKDGVERGMLKWYLMFLDHFLLGLDNKVDELMYDVNIADNITGQMQCFDYDVKVEERGTILPGAHYQNIYLTPGPAGKAGRLSYYPPVTAVEHFADMDIHAQIGRNNNVNPAFLGATARPSQTVSLNTTQGNLMISATTGQWCEDAFLNITRANSTTANTYTNEQIFNAVDQPVAGRLMYLSEPLTERMQLSGAAVAHIRTALDRGTGSLSVALLEIGRVRHVGVRTGSTAATTGSTVVFPAFGSGAAATSATRYANPVASNYSNFKFVTWGHTDLQNPSYDGKAWHEVPEQNYIPNYYFQTTKLEIGKFYDYVVELNPYNYTFEAGTRIGVMVYGTDPLYSPLLSPECTPEFDVQLGAGSYVNLPLKLAEPTEAVTIEVGSKSAALGDTVEISYDIKDNAFGFKALDMELPFDSSIYTPVKATAAAALAGADFDFAIGSNALKVTVAAKDNIMGDGALFTVTYKVKESAPYVFKTPLDVKVKAAKFGSLIDKLVDLDVTVKAGALKSKLDSLVPVAVVEKLNGNKNNLSIDVTETYEDTKVVVHKKIFSIDNNAADTYVVGPYKVYVDTKGNTQIRACYVVR
jgi:predicted acyl esterase